MVTSKTYPALKESAIQNLILAYLRTLGIFAWENKSVGVYDSKRNAFRLNESTYSIRGVSDILGICYKTGRIITIEVKTVKEYTYTLKHWDHIKDTIHNSNQEKKLHLQRQILFIDSIKKDGGIAFFSDSIETTKLELIRYGVIDEK